MHAPNRAWMALFAAVLLAASGCTNDALDDGDGPENVLAITALSNQPVTAQLQGGGGVQSCTLQVQAWTGTASNVPLSEPAGPDSTPFNDIVLDTVEITYDWIDGVATTPTRVVGLGDIQIAPNGSASFSFEPIAFQDLNSDVIGQTANLTLVFHARTVEGAAVPRVVQRQLFVEACPAAP